MTPYFRLLPMDYLITNCIMTVDNVVLPCVISMALYSICTYIQCYVILKLVLISTWKKERILICFFVIAPVRLL